MDLPDNLDQQIQPSKLGPRGWGRKEVVSSGLSKEFALQKKGAMHQAEHRAADCGEPVSESRACRGL